MVAPNKCSNLECRNSLTHHRGTSNLSKYEKEYGLLCERCRALLEITDTRAIECMRCGTLVSIEYLKGNYKRKKACCFKCRVCGGRKSDEKYIITGKITIIFCKMFTELAKRSNERARRKYYQKKTKKIKNE